MNGLLAQLVEQGTLNAWVGGSSPSQPTSIGLVKIEIHEPEFVERNYPMVRIGRTYRSNPFSSALAAPVVKSSDHDVNDDA